MYRAAIAVVGDWALAEDVVQEAILKAWRHREDFRGEASIRTWLLRITHNTAISMLRSKRELPLDPQNLTAVPIAGAEEATLHRMFQEAFEEALFQLDELSRAVLALRELDALSYREIGQVLQVTPATVKTRLFRARKRLASLLAEWGPGS